MSNMAVRRGIAAVLLMASLRIGEASHGRVAQVPETAKIHIWLVDLAGLPEKIRLDAEAQASMIFRRAGVDLSFVDCLTEGARPCRPGAGKGDFWLQILAEPPKHLKPDAMGFAVLPPTQAPGDSYAAVSYPVVAAFARDLDAAPADVLAAGLAHEIGHLLLHSSAHARSGVMSPRMDRRQIRLMERGELLFTPEEQARLVERVREFGR